MHPSHNNFLEYGHSLICTPVYMWYQEYHLTHSILQIPYIMKPDVFLTNSYVLILTKR